MDVVITFLAKHTASFNHTPVHKIGLYLSYPNCRRQNAERTFIEPTNSEANNRSKRTKLWYGSARKFRERRSYALKNLYKVASRQTSETIALLTPRG
jgi:hypothetical protein